MRISDWSSDVCSSDLVREIKARRRISGFPVVDPVTGRLCGILTNRDMRFEGDADAPAKALMTHENLITVKEGVGQSEARDLLRRHRSEEHTYELQSLMRISYAVI